MLALYVEEESKLVKLITEANQYGLKLDTQTAPSTQNTDDNRSEKHIAEPNANNIEHCRSLAACASVKRHRHPFARSRRVIFSGYASCDGIAGRELYKIIPLSTDDNWSYTAL